MLKPLIRTLDGWRFELPLALVLGAAIAFAMIAMPYSPFSHVHVVVAHRLEQPLQWLLAAFVAVIAAVIAYRAMKYPRSSRAVAPVVEQDAEEDAPPIDVALRLRRSDAHPDFPPREPIRASRDLGEPFMDIVGFGEAERPSAFPEHHEAPIEAAVFEEVAPEPEAEPAPVALPIASEHEPDPVASLVAPEPPVVHEIIVAPSAPTPSPLTLVGEVDEHPSIAAFTPEPVIQPVPQLERPQRESLAEMMERLSAGLERRAGRPVAPPPADMLAEVLARPRAATPELRDALDELNRLAGRRG